jgi:hypothetical protein
MLLIFEYQNDSYKYELSFEDTFDGSYLMVCTSFLERPNSRIITGLPIKNDKIVWLPDNVASLELTPEVMEYADRLMQLKAFW